jgi:hypothetical protein
VGPDCFTIFEECGRFWDGRLGGVLDLDQGRSWKYSPGSHVPDLGRVASYGARVVPFNLASRDDVLNDVRNKHHESGDTMEIIEIQPTRRTHLAVLWTPISEILVLDQRRGSDPLLEHVSFISFN